MNHALSYTENSFIIILSVLNKQNIILIFFQLNIIQICSTKLEIIIIKD